MTVYADEAFLLNGAVDYLLLVCAAKLGGGRMLRLRLALAAAFGGVYAAAALFPALAFLRQLPVKLASLAAMLLIAFGAGRGTLRTGALFFAAVCAFGGAAVAAAFPMPEADSGEILTNARQADAVRRALEYLRAAREAMAAGFAPDAVLTECEGAMDALGLALKAGSAKAVNLVLLGRLSRYFHFTDEQWQDAIEKSVPAKFLELNQKAFALGAEG